MAQNPRLALEAQLWQAEESHCRYYRCLLFLLGSSMLSEHEYQKIRARIDNSSDLLATNEDHMREISHEGD